MWCIQTVDGEYRKRMYDILDLYANKNRQVHVIAIDEKPKQIISEKRRPIPMKKDTANIFIAVKPRRGRRIANVTERRAKRDFANLVKDILDSYPEARKLLLVMNNLNTHFPGVITETFGEEKKKRMLSRLEFHYTPKHTSWLDIAEIEINVINMEYIDRRFENLKELEQKVRTETLKRNH